MELVIRPATSVRTRWLAMTTIEPRFHHVVNGFKALVFGASREEFAHWCDGLPSFPGVQRRGRCRG